MSGGLHIGAVAKETGFSIDAIRFYERRGLLRHLAKTESGYRVFDENSLDDLKFIRKSKELGFSLPEIREMLVLRRSGSAGCCHVREMISEKLALIDSKIQELARLREELKLALRKCNRNLKGGEGQDEKPCQVLEELGHTSGNHRV